MPPSADRTGAPAGAEWWHCRAVRDGAVTWFAVVPATQEHPDGTLIDLVEDDALALVGDSAACTVHLDGDVATSLVLPMPAGSSTPELWFTEVVEASAAPPALNLVAFTGHGVPAGSLLDAAAVAGTDATSADQVAALRWYPGTGEVDQVYVAPTWRRRGISGAIVLAAGSLSIARGGRRLWGDGQRTAVGERMRNASTWSHRAADLTHLAPPMTPFDER